RWNIWSKLSLRYTRTGKQNRLTMKFIFALLVLLPIVFCAPNERFILDTFGLDAVLKPVEAFAHSGMGQDACVSECQKLVQGFLGSMCGTACTT
ncbi:Hypothetical predicted protein, partial [Mytilus galloprovincialis]